MSASPQAGTGGFPRIWLASASPRRAELLRVAGIDFDVLKFPAIEERQTPGESAEDYVRRVAAEKADAGREALVRGGLESRLVLAADTEVCLDDAVFGKPRDAKHAAWMLERLSGREHRVLSAVVARDAARTERILVVSRVRFGALSRSDIEAYIASGEPFGKAGGYAIQGRAAAFIAAISGSYSGIMGLPLYETLEILRSFPWPKKTS